MPSSERTPPSDQPGITERPPVADAGPWRYRVREARLPIGYDYVVEDAHGRHVFDVDGKLLSVRQSLTIRDVDGRERCKILGGLLDVKSALHILDGETALATVKRAHLEAAPDRYVVDLADGGELAVIGDVAARSYSISRGGHILAVVKQRSGVFGGGYEVEISTGRDRLTVLAMTVCLEVMAH